MPKRLFEPDNPMLLSLIENWDGKPNLYDFAKRVGYTPDEILTIKRTGELGPKKLTMSDLILKHMKNPNGETKKQFLERNSISASTYDRLATRNRSEGKFVKPRVDLDSLTGELYPYVRTIEAEFPNLTAAQQLKYAKVLCLEKDFKYKDMSMTDRAASMKMSRQYYYEIRDKVAPCASRNSVDNRSQSFLLLPRQLRDVEWYTDDNYKHIVNTPWFDLTIRVANGEELSGKQQEEINEFHNGAIISQILDCLAQLSLATMVKENNDSFVQPFKQIQPRIKEV